MSDWPFCYVVRIFLLVSQSVYRWRGGEAQDCKILPFLFFSPYIFTGLTVGYRKGSQGVGGIWAGFAVRLANFWLVKSQGLNYTNCPNAYFWAIITIFWYDFNIKITVQTNKPSKKCLTHLQTHSIQASPPFTNQNQFLKTIAKKQTNAKYHPPKIRANPIPLPT